MNTRNKVAVAINTVPHNWLVSLAADVSSPLMTIMSYDSTNMDDRSKCQHIEISSMSSNLAVVANATRHP